MKNLITSVLCATLVLLPVQRPKAQIAPVIFVIVITAVVVAGGVIVCVRSSRPQYWCVQDQESKAQWCRITTRREISLSDWKIISGPHYDAAECDRICSSTNQPTARLQAASSDLQLVTIERSTDCRNWLVTGTTWGTPDDFAYYETNALSSAYYYRARF